MPEDSKTIYQLINRLKHTLIDKECQKFVQRIIAVRPGVRQYASTLKNTPKDADVKALMFNLIFW